eukprot:TRINITY_DN59753_c0_g3_i1.p1 TRINITY_DN59753_c0_g3~~TRINITY_DN59753_c0_g3_i1.p1  ORF type:complete len:532 (-),score=97.90 TRINITY_DN59753_c0_g3_i1:67-1662(-)
MRAYQWVELGALVFTLAACSSSADLARRHLAAAGPRNIRAYTIRILLMVPVYSIMSWVALVSRVGDFNKVLALVRKGCESVVVISFGLLLLAWLGGPQALSERLEPGRCRHLPPLSLVLPSWSPAQKFVRRTSFGVLQNAICSMVSVSSILISWCLAASGLCPRAFEIVQPFCLVLMNGSQFFAVYCVIILYNANRGPLAKFRPVLKLLGIKGLVFCLFWQEAAIRILERAGVFDKVAHAVLQDQWTVSQVAWGLLNCIICVEMLVLSLLHWSLYPPGELRRLRKLVATANHMEPVSPRGNGAAVYGRSVSFADDDVEVQAMPSDASEPGTELMCATASSELRGLNGRSASLHMRSGDLEDAVESETPPISPSRSASTFSLSPPISRQCSVGNTVSVGTTTCSTAGGAEQSQPLLWASSEHRWSGPSEADDEPELDAERKDFRAEIWRRLWSALDVSDFHAFYKELRRGGSGAETHREEPDEDDCDPEIEASGSDMLPGGRMRNRGSSVALHHAAAAVAVAAAERQKMVAV